MAKEREIVARWIRRYRELNPTHWVYRLFDLAYAGGQPRPFDVLVIEPLVDGHQASTAYEFKVDRRKTFAFDLYEVSLHQLVGLSRFSQAGGTAIVMVWHEADREFHRIEVQHDNRAVQAILSRKLAIKVQSKEDRHVQKAEIAKGHEG